VDDRDGARVWLPHAPAERGLTFRGRLVLLVVAITLVTLGLGFVAVSVAMNHFEELRFDRALIDEARREAAVVAGTDLEHVGVSDTPVPATSDVGPVTKYGAIYDVSGRVLATTSNLDGGGAPVRTPAQLYDEGFDVWHGSQHLRAVLVPIPRHQGLTLLIAAPRTDLDSDGRFLHRAMAIALAVAVTWTALVARWVVSRLMRDHERVAKVAQQVALGDLTARVRTNSRDPELAVLGRNIDDMIARLAVLVESQQRFIALAAHELRAPLTTLYGELSHALRRPRDESSYRAAIEEALDSTRRLKALADSLLASARLGSDWAPPMTPVWLDRVARTAIASLHSACAQRHVTVSLHADPCEVTGNGNELERMVRNVVENALQFSPEGGVITVTLGTDDKAARIRVCDEGPGLPVDERENVFQPFYRVNDRPSEGVGLGLVIVRQIARAHHGDVQFVDAPGQRGAVLEITLPRSATRRGS